MEPAQANHAVSASVARMHAKAAQLAEELHLAQLETIGPPQGEPASQRRHGLVQPITNLSGLATISNASPMGTPAVFKRLTQGANAAGKLVQSASLESYQAAILQSQRLEAELQLWKGKHAAAVKELDRRQESYMRREEQLLAKLAAGAPTAAQQQHSSVPSGAGATAGPVEDGDDRASYTDAGLSSLSANQQSQKVQALQEMQQQALHGLNELLQRQRLHMHAEEAQQLRQFRSKLAEIEAQMQADKQAAAAHQGNWMDKTVALREELAATQDIATKLDAMYKIAEQEAAQLRVQFKAQEDDRQHLIKQMLGFKRENTRLKQEQTSLQEELDAIMTLALEAEDGAAAAAEPGLSSSQGAITAAADTAAGTSHLAAAIADVVSRRAHSSVAGGSNAAAGGGKPGNSHDGSRPGSAAGHHKRQPAYTVEQPDRPWSVTSTSHPQQQQHTHGQHKLEGVPMDLAAISAKMQRYSQVIHKLQKLLESERRQLRQARSNYATELGRRNELQTLLLHSIQQVKQQRREAESAYSTQQHQKLQDQSASSHVGRPGSPLIRGSSNNSSRARPGTAAAAPGARRQQQCSSLGRPTGAALRSVGPAAAWGWAGQTTAADGQPVDQAAWDTALNDLLTKQQVLELLFGKTFPDFMSGTEEHHEQQQQHGRQLAWPLGQKLPAATSADHQQQPLHQGTLGTIANGTDGFGGNQCPMHRVFPDASASASDDDIVSTSFEVGLEVPRLAASQPGDSFSDTDSQLGIAHEASIGGTDDSDEVLMQLQQQQLLQLQQQQQDQQQQQQSVRSVPQNTEPVTSASTVASSLAAPVTVVGSVSLASMCAPLMPGFRSKQPLNHTVVHRAPSSGAGRTHDRPASALTVGSSVDTSRNKFMKGRHDRPSSAASTASAAAAFSGTTASTQGPDLQQPQHSTSSSSPPINIAVRASAVQSLQLGQGIPAPAAGPTSSWSRQLEHGTGVLPLAPGGGGGSIFAASRPATAALAGRSSHKETVAARPQSAGRAAAAAGQQLSWIQLA